jgi:hypothetical protein
MKKVSATITIDVTAWVENDYDTGELIEYLSCYYRGSVPDGWVHGIEDMEYKQTVSNIIVENEE